MTDLIIGKTNVTELLESRYAGLDPGMVTLLYVPNEHNFEVNMESIKILQEAGYEGIYITLSKPAIELAEMFEEKGIDLEKICFIDGISQMYGSKQIENAKYVLGPLAIAAISTIIYSTIPKLKSSKKFVFLDSITTILLYNPLPRTIQLFYFITQILKKEKAVGMVVLVSRGAVNEKLIKELEKISDETIKISG